MMPLVSGWWLCVGAVSWALPPSDEGRRRNVRGCSFSQLRNKHLSLSMSGCVTLAHWFSTCAWQTQLSPPSLYFNQFTRWAGGQRNSQHLIDTYICSYYIWKRLLFWWEAGEWQRDLSRLQRLSSSSMTMDVFLSTDSSQIVNIYFPFL